uniref:Uncharacterized protein n=1 Tax=Hordeum vulgare subsp. vulgare TaxID=112509 RepID=A0A287H7L0_HORVV
MRPNRAASSGYWKATGTDKPIHDAATSQGVGVKKALVFYKGRPPKGTKTAWIMQEYRLAADPLAAAVNTYKPIKFRNVSMRLDDWVLCRIYNKTGLGSPMVPLLADYDHMADHDDLFGGSDFDDATCRPMIKSQQQQHQQQHQQPHDGRFPTFPSMSELFDDYAFVQMFNTDVEHGVHPSRNQLLPVGDSRHVVEPSYYAPSSSPDASGGSAGKRKAGSPEESATHQPSAKKLNGSCFDAPSQSANDWQAVASVLGGLNHYSMLPQF